MGWWLLAWIGCSSPVSSGDTATRSFVSTLEPIEAPLREELVIIGSGAAGLGAYLAAVELGVDPWVLEREAQVGGNGTAASHFWAAGTSHQLAEGVDDSAAFALSEWSEFTEGDGDDPRVAHFCEDSADTLAWLESYGLTVTELKKMDHTGSVARIHAASPALLWSHLDAEDVCLECEVVSLGPGTLDRWRMVVEDLRTGDRFPVEAPHVIVATGGFARNLDRVLEAWPMLVEDDVYFEASPITLGTSLDLLEQAGGALLHTENGLLLDPLALEDPLLGAPEMAVLDGQGLALDARGERIATPGFADVPAQLTAAGGAIYLLYDATAAAVATAGGRGFNYDTPASEHNWSLMDWAELTETPMGSLADIAAAMDWDEDALACEVDRFNTLVSAGEDEDFGEDLHPLAPFVTEPWVLVPLQVATSKSIRGVATDASDFVVLDADGSPLPGLYAAGEAAGFLGGPDLGVGFNGSVAAAWWGGREAGTVAASTILATR